mmetsp:Transcript_10060/g.18350  ORF Transcript_10060/g.18350 Transcript_10060/m.18350 type:complete len:208 (+) Transcript_10060:373-996(+)
MASLIYANLTLGEETLSLHLLFPSNNIYNFGSPQIRSRGTCGTHKWHCESPPKILSMIASIRIDFQAPLPHENIPNPLVTRTRHPDNPQVRIQIRSIHSVTRGIEYFLRNRPIEIRDQFRHVPRNFRTPRRSQLVSIQVYDHPRPLIDGVGALDRELAIGIEGFAVLRVQPLSRVRYVAAESASVDLLDEFRQPHSFGCSTHEIRRE